MNMSFSNDSIDIIIASNAIHHFYSPAKFFLECHRVLKNNGLILINETTTSLTMRSIMKLMKHEAYDFGVDVFDENVICNDKNDPWSANCAVSELLFTNEEIFNKKFLGLKIINQEFCEFSIFLLSGGVVSKVPMVELPKIILNLFNIIDKVLVFFFPSIFALSRRVVIKKNS